jgi:hypothetical protein
LPRNRAVYKTIKGIEHKLCTGPLHREGKFVPVSKFHARRNYRHRGQCIACNDVSKGSEPLVPYLEIRFAVEELCFRLGQQETARRLHTRPPKVWAWRKGRAKFVKRSTARRIISLLAQVRANNEARHRRSIKHGAAMRGRAERVPYGIYDFNGRNDWENARKRLKRAA